MKKRILTLILTGAVAVSALVGCNNNQTTPNSTTSTEKISNAPETDNKNNKSTDTEQENQPSDQQPTEKISAESIAAAIKAAYGDNYLPNTQMDAEMLSLKFSFDADSYTEIFAETPMIGAHPDTLVIVKAAEGKLDDVKSKLTAYRESLVNDTMQYPMNIPKIHASQVVTNGDYAAFILLGAVNENVESPEEEQASFAEEQVKIGVDAFNKCFE